MDKDFFTQHIHPGEKVGMINLGCARNLVDAQEILGRLQEEGRLVVSPSDASVIILNTCGFIEEAKRESIDKILDLIDLKQEGKIRKIFVAGCLSERYPRELSKEFAEVDGITGIHPFQAQGAPSQIYLTPAHFAYLKICESCYNHCSFCAIPLIKGPFRSRTQEAVIEEVRRLDQRGVKEINIIGQDITAYGMDLYGEKVLASLLRKLCRETRNVEWIRLLYTYPAHITDELIDVIATEKKICKYLDIPLQHIHDRLLMLMGRKMKAGQIRELLGRVRKRVPGVHLRSSFIVGFPQETGEEFQALQDFIEEIRFDRVGAFLFSPEDGTPAARLPGQLPLRVKRKRYDSLMSRQQKISRELSQEKVGAIFRVLIDEKQKAGENSYIGRTEYDAPEVDGLVYVATRQSVQAGSFVQVKITDSLEYDLVGEEV